MKTFIVYHRNDTDQTQSMKMYKKQSLVQLLYDLKIDFGWEEPMLSERILDPNFHMDINVEKDAIDYIGGDHGYNGNGDNYWIISEAYTIISTDISMSVIIE